MNEYVYFNNLRFNGFDVIKIVYQVYEIYVYDYLNYNYCRYYYNRINRDVYLMK